MTAREPRGAPFKYVGGKRALAEWIASWTFGKPEFSTYVEPFAGSAAVFWRVRRRFSACVLNDLDCAAVNFFRVLRDPEARRDLLALLRWTPDARAEFVAACAIRRAAPRPPPDPPDVELAWAYYVTQHLAFAGGANPTPGRYGADARAAAGRSFRASITELEAFGEALVDARLEWGDGVEIARKYDSPSSFFYLDPPYPDDETTFRGAYAAREDGDDLHDRLLAWAANAKGGVVLSSFRNARYDEALVRGAGWTVETRKRTVTVGLKRDGAGRTVEREEALYVSPRVAELRRRRLLL